MLQLFSQKLDIMVKIRIIYEIFHQQVVQAGEVIETSHNCHTIRNTLFKETKSSLNYIQNIFFKSEKKKILVILEKITKKLQGHAFIVHCLRFILILFMLFKLGKDLFDKMKRITYHLEKLILILYY